jgi:hypothetical protein
VDEDARLEVQRQTISAALAGGLATAWQSRAYEDADVRCLVGALQALGADDVIGKIRLAGFTLQPFVNREAPEIEQSCSTCMYYESHRRYCNLPELELGVKPQWSCVLWRI